MEHENQQTPGQQSDMSENGLFFGDRGSLPLEARKVLIRLVKGPYIDREQNHQQWNTLLGHEDTIRSQCANLLLRLIIDHDLGVAFLKQESSETLEFPRLLRRTKLVFIDSVLVLYLRQQLNEAEAFGRRAVVALDEMRQHLSVYETKDNLDRAGFIKRVDAAIEKAKKNNFIKKIRGSEGRFEVSPILKLLFSAAEVGQLLESYSRTLNEKVSGNGTAASSEEDRP